MVLEIVLALIGVVAGGGLVKILQWGSGNSKSLRKELRSEIKELKDRTDSLEAESDEWQTRAFHWFQKYQMFKLKVYQTMVEHEIPLAVITELLGEEDQWVLVQ